MRVLTQRAVSCDEDKLSVNLEEDIEATTLEELAEDMPVSEPRFIIYSYRWKRRDGRVSYPMIMIYYKPACSAVQNMLYGSSQQALMTELRLQTVLSVTDADDLTEEWLLEELGKLNRA